MIQENFIKIYENSFKENWSLPALTDYSKNVTFTFEDVAKEIARIHILFEECQIRRGDKIALIGKDSARWCIVYMAAVTYGAIIVPHLARFQSERRTSYYQSFRIGLPVRQRPYLGFIGRG